MNDEMHGDADILRNAIKAERENAAAMDRLRAQAVTERDVARSALTELGRQLEEAGIGPGLRYPTIAAMAEQLWQWHDEAQTEKMHAMAAESKLNKANAVSDYRCATLAHEIRGVLHTRNLWCPDVDEELSFAVARGLDSAMQLSHSYHRAMDTATAHIRLRDIENEKLAGALVNAQAEREAARAERDAAVAERDMANRAWEQADDERERFSDALIEAHRSLGGDGEWVAKPGATCAAGETGDLAIDVPALAETVRNREWNAAIEACAKSCEDAHNKPLDPEKPWLTVDDMAVRFRDLARPGAEEEAG